MSKITWAFFHSSKVMLLISCFIEASLPLWQNTFSPLLKKNCWKELPLHPLLQSPFAGSHSQISTLPILGGDCIQQCHQSPCLPLIVLWIAAPSSAVVCCGAALQDPFLKLKIVQLESIKEWTLIDFSEGVQTLLVHATIQVVLLEVHEMLAWQNGWL